MRKESTYEPWKHDKSDPWNSSKLKSNMRTLQKVKDECGIAWKRICCDGDPPDALPVVDRPGWEIAACT